MFYVFNLRKYSRKIVLAIIFIIIIYFVINIINIFKNLFPMKYYDIINKYAIIYNIDPKIIVSVINAESKFKKNAVSSKEARGLMQIRKCTADWAAKEIGIKNYDFSKIFIPDINIQIGTWYLRNLFNKYENLDAALAAYNAGSGIVSSWLKNDNYSSDGKKLDYIPYKETRKYIKKIKLNMKVYKIILWRKRCIERFLYL